jgi:hypothetical protein
MKSIKTDTFVGLDIVRKIGMERVFDMVCKYLKVDGDDIKSSTRLKEVAEARHVFCFLAYNSIAAHTLKEIGQFINRDHATVLHSKNTIFNFLDFDPRIQKIIADLRTSLGKFSGDDVENNKITAVHVGFYNTYKRKKDLQQWAERNDVVSKINFVRNI